MNKSIIAILFFCFVSSTYASTYLGKVGPFSADKFEEKSLDINKCNFKIKSLLLAATHRSGKYSIPRFAYREILTEMKSGKSINFISESETNDIKALKMILPAGDCASKVSINAISTGLNPGNSNEVYIEVWGNKN